MKKIILFLVALGLGAVALDAQIGAKTGDPGVRAQLDESGLKYSVTSSGRFKLQFDFDDEERSHVVLVNSEVETYQDISVREIWCTIAELDGELDLDIALDLLYKNEAYKLGTFSAEYDEEDDTSWIYFKVMIDNQADTDTLVTMIKLVAKVGDSVENELFGLDEY